MKRFIAGLSLGVIAGLLLTPKRGKLMRAALRDRARRAYGSVLDAARTRKHKSPPPSKKSPSSAVSSTMNDEREPAAEVLNTASRDALIAVHGIGQVLAERIIENRPYRKAFEVVEKGILPEPTFVQLRRELLEKGA